MVLLRMLDRYPQFCLQLNPWSVVLFCGYINGPANLYLTSLDLQQWNTAEILEFYCFILSPSTEILSQVPVSTPTPDPLSNFDPD